MGKARSLAVTAVLGMAGALVSPPTVAARGLGSAEILTADLIGATEVPGPGDPDGRGIAVLRIDPDNNFEICFWFVVRRIAPATVAHIHRGAAGVAGPAVQGLTPPTGGNSKGCVENPVIAEEILDNPAAFYINVHNTPYPLGAVRGQLTAM
jgi:hypothetical protein